MGLPDDRQPKRGFPLSDRCRSSFVAPVIYHYDFKIRPVRLSRKGLEASFKRDPVVVDSNNDADANTNANA
jgi:hypothetical protein